MLIVLIIKKNITRYYNTIWTKESLTNDQICALQRTPHSIDIEIGKQKIVLCHFSTDVQYNYSDV